MPDRPTVAVKALNHIRDFFDRPVDLARILAESCKSLDLTPSITVKELVGWLMPASDKSHVRQVFHGLLSRWDYRANADWSHGTEASSSDRRRLICAHLGLREGEEAIVEQLFPVYPKIDQPTRITDSDPGAPSWYDEDRRTACSFYWKSYERYLLREKNWDPKNVAVLDSTSTDVISDLWDPCSSESRVSKGLVVGYVQSGKTANFTGVIAKAMDAGFRLIIVLGGLQNTLRAQTQRRLDKELVGREMLSAGSDEYQSDSDWDDFNRHGDIPEREGAFNIDRLTTGTQDFRNPPGDLSRLRFQKSQPSLPFNHQENLGRHPAKLIVIKKNKTPLTNLLNALGRSRSAGMAWSEIPSLIIDDESDQASLNGKKPSPSDQRKRTEINRLIVEIVATLERSQYVGYTATPFANVFVNPDDAEDLFPSTFITSLPRPDGYMGVSDFYDPIETGRSYKRRKPASDSNFGRHIRPVDGDDDKSDNLQQAIDAFVLSGAVKLFRQAGDASRKYKHHTMLVHLTTSVLAHSRLKDKIEGLFADSAYAAGGPGFARLKSLWASDFSIVSGDSASKDGAMPTFSELKRYIGTCVSNVSSDGGCALVLNGDDREVPPDFDKSGVWKIIVGGAKLSRGYTVEGLTVSYYRRVAGAADTLMQMGRWFGYREGYRDLVRLYIGVDEPKGRERVDLYEAFRCICEDEEEFRSQLALYSRLKGDERLTPKEVPPLVPSHMLIPTSKNKMYNARILFVNYGGQQKQSTIASTEPAIKDRNESAAITLLQQANVRRLEVSLKRAAEKIEFAAYAGVANLSAALSFLQAYKFGPLGKDQEQLQLIREFLSGVHGDHGISRWAIVAPQFANESSGRTWSVPGIGDLSIRRRERVGDGQRRYNVFTESRHVELAELITGVRATFSAVNSDTRALCTPSTAAMLLYPVLSEDELKRTQPPTIGFSVFFPENSIVRKVKYGVRSDRDRRSVVVDIGQQ